jgi:hypothetical protein
MRFQRRGGRKRIVAPDGCEIVPTTKPRPDSTLVKALARAWRWQKVSTSTRQSLKRPRHSPWSIATITCSGVVERVADAWDHAAIAPRRFAIQPRR